MAQLKIGVMGSASGNHSKESLEKAAAVGKAIAEKGCVLFYGATIGFPQAAARAARQAKGLVVGISPAANEKEHLESYRYPVGECDIMVYTGLGFQGRNVVLGRSCDAVVIVGGRIGTMSEFAVAYAEGRVIGILEGTGGFADKVKELDEQVLKKEKPARIIYDSDPKRLVEKILNELQSKA